MCIDDPWPLHDRLRTLRGELDPGIAFAEALVEAERMRIWRHFGYEWFEHYLRDELQIGQLESEAFAKAVRRFAAGHDPGMTILLDVVRYLR